MAKNIKELARQTAQAEIEFNKQVLSENGHKEHQPLNLLVDIMGIQHAHENATERNRL